MKTKTFEQIGWIIRGTAKLKHWGGGEGFVRMDEVKIPLNKLTPKNILRCVNDGGFGCEAITEAEIDIYVDYGGGVDEFERTMHVCHPIHAKYFLGWRELEAQGINY